MMNVLGLSLVLTSLAAAGVFSPTPAADTTRQQQQPASTIVKEGHRVVVVEYDQDGHHNTKISISPPEHGVLGNAKDKIKEAASVLPNVGQGISQEPHTTTNTAFLHASRDLICDAYGSCKHKIASAMGKAKDKAHEVLDMEIATKREVAREVADTVSDAAGKAKEAVYDKAQDVKEYTRESVEKAKDTSQAIKSHMVRNASNARDKLMGVKGAVKRAASASYVGVMRQLDSLTRVADLMGFATAYGMCVWVTFISSFVLSRAMPRQQFAVVQSKIYPVYFRAMAYSIGMALLGHLLGHRKRLFSSNAETLQAYNLVASLLTVILNSLYLEPRATKLMLQRMKMEKEEGRGRDDLAMPEQRSRRTAEEQQSTVPDPKEFAGTGHSHGHGSNTETASAASPTRGIGVEHDAIGSKIIKLNEKLKKLNSYSSILNIMTLMSLTWHLVYLAQCDVHHIC